MGTVIPDDEHAGFVGRRAELAELSMRLRAAAEGHGGLVLLSGPAGIGKTRTVEEATAGAPAVAWGRCVDDPGAPPLWPWHRLARTLPTVASAMAEVSSRNGVINAGSADAEAARFMLLAAAADALLEAAEPDGLVVVLEDLHWADETSLRLLGHLAGELRDSRLLIVGTCRDPAGDAGGKPLDRALPDLLRRPTTTALALGPLTEDDVRAYLPGAPGESVRAAHRRSGGNPLYLRAIARAPATAEGERGAELRHLVRTTLTSLPPGVLDLLDAAAVLGEEVDADRLAAVTGRAPDEVRGGLDVAVGAGVLAAVPDLPGRRRFVHAVVRDGVYADLPPSRREDLHRRSAEALERLSDDDSAAGLVAGHWLRADSGPGTLRRAASWARRAATAATAACAFDEATRYLDLAVDAARRSGADGAELAALLVELATAEFRAGRFGRSLEQAVSAADAATAAGRPDLLAEAALAVHDVGAVGFPPVLVRLTEQALDALDGVAAPALRSRLLSQAASSLADAGRLRAAAARAAEALALAEDCGDPEAVLDAIRSRMKAGPTGLDVTERLRLGRLAIEHSTRSRRPLAALWGAKWRIDAALEVGDMALVEHELARIRALADSTRLPLVRWHDRRLRASVEALFGRFPEALALNEEARVIGVTDLADDLSAMGLSGAFSLQHALVTGDLRQWHPDTVASLQAADAVPIVDVSRALVALLRGRRDEAAARYGELRGRITDPDFLISPGVVLNLVPLVEEFRDVTVAEPLRGAMAPHPAAATGAGVYCQGSTFVLVARLDVVLGRLDEAVTGFEQALTVDSRTGARPAAVNDRIGLAEALLARRGPGDLGRAAELTRSAAEEARRLAMPDRERRAAAVAHAARRAARAADPLTAREREIAGLVADALTNRQIADRLVVSERTVESHVHHALAKLGLANRTELATVVRDGRSG